MKVMIYAVVILVHSFHAVLSFPLNETIDLFEREECKDNRDDCTWIADNHYDIPKYCMAHRNDAFIKDCPKYCGFCKVPAPVIVPVEGCKDTRSDCNWIVENTDAAKYCYEYRNDPEVRKCAKTCGFCKPPAPSKSQKCEDVSKQCSWITKNYHDVTGYCRKHRSDILVQQCTKTCEFCKLPKPAPEPQTCQDTRDDCSWIEEHNEDVAAYCDRHKNDAFIKQCQRTCGYCKPPVQPKPYKCEDTIEDCSWIAKYYDDVPGYCRRHRNDSFIKQCTKTCEFCKYPTVPQLHKCHDMNEHCSWIAEHYSDVTGYCNRHRDNMFIKQCRKTCGFCKVPEPPKPYRCEDTNKRCSWITNTHSDVIGYCNKHKSHSFIKQCPKTCEFCKYPTTPQPQKCEDISNDCSWIAENYGDVIGYCRRHRNDAFIKSCRKTCGFCEPPLSLKSYYCRDTRSDCKWIVEQHKDVLGFCSKRNDSVVQQCFKTCELCKQPPLSLKCEDTRDDCSWLTKYYDDVPGYCRRHSNDSFIKQCTRTCELCKHPITSSICEDINENCWWITKNYVDAEGYCKRHKDDGFIKECRKTCGFCKPPAQSVCEDTREDCSWITRNIADIASYCERWKYDAAVKECRKTCGFCR